MVSALTGHCEGDTLVFETAGFNDKTVLDLRGHAPSELHVTECSAVQGKIEIRNVATQWIA